MLIGTACSSPAEPGVAQQPTEEAIALFDCDLSLPLDLQTHGIESLDGLTVHDISFSSPKGGRVPGYLFVPDGEGPFAGMLIMHGLPGHRDQLRGRGSRYARTGAVVAAISAPHGRPDASPRDYAVTFTPRDTIEQVQYIVDLRRAIDILVSRSDVDPSRIGAVGGSYSGGMAGLLSGVEDRVAAYAFVVGDGGLDEHFRGSPQATPGWLNSLAPISPRLFVGRAAPAELLYHNGRLDEFVRPEDAERFQMAGSEPKEIRWYDRGHDLGEEAELYQVAWFAQRIGIAADRYVW